MVTGGQLQTDNQKNCLQVNDIRHASWPTIRAEAAQLENTTDTIRITYYGENIPKEFFVDIPSEVNLTEKHGFNLERGEYRYNGADTPYIEYRLTGEDSYWDSARAEDWTFAPLPYHANVDTKFNTSHVGVVGDHHLLLGNYTEYTTSLGCHEISLIVSNSSNMDAKPHEVLNALRYSAENLDVGHRYDHVRIFAIPGRPDPSAAGKASGNEAWITTQDIGYTNISSLAIHEYVHTRQAFDAAGLQEMVWFTEATASYYQHRFTYETGGISAQRYNKLLKNGSEINAELGNQSTWSAENTEYRRGFAYVAVLDQKLKTATNGSYSVEKLIRDINNKPSTSGQIMVQRELFIDRIRNNTGIATANWANASIDANSSFNHASATVAEPSMINQVASLFTERVREDPIGGMSVVLLIGLSFGIAFKDIIDNWFGDE